MAAAGRRFAAGPPPLALYVHVPWCVRKCPYCDFNSHAASTALPETAYVDALLADLELDLDLKRAAAGADRPVVSIFIGGGTPSLLSGAAVARLLDGIRRRVRLAAAAEITLEANPGTVDAGHFAAYREAGVNRLSIGVQSLSARHLRALGRIHDPDQARAAVATARRAGFDNVNLDLMFGLPGQTLAEARADLNAVLALAPEHVSFYQLTLEPNTPFHHAPPPDLPDDDLADDMQQQGLDLLAAAGYRRYEVSAFARPGRCCRHNLNYWTFGDYIGIGAGAHGKLSDAATGQVRRRARQRGPAAYLESAVCGDPVSSERLLDDADLVLEFALNAFRLVEGVDVALFAARTGLAAARIGDPIASAVADGLLAADPGRLRPTGLGLRFANELIARFAD
jgi:oxygen-independent coproporphyrinogen-3 oxidase